MPEMPGIWISRKSRSTGCSWRNWLASIAFEHFFTNFNEVIFRMLSSSRSNANGSSSTARQVIIRVLVSVRQQTNGFQWCMYRGYTDPCTGDQAAVLRCEDRCRSLNPLLHYTLG